MSNYSFLMSVYHKDNVDYLEKSLISMINQTKKPDEIVIVEDGKLPKEISVLLDTFDMKYPKLFYRVKLNENTGLGNALNKGLAYCKNDLVARMDADDISLEHRCEEQLKVFDSNNSVAVLGSYVEEFNETSRKGLIRKVPHGYDNIVRFSKKRNPFNHPTVMFRKSIIMKSGGYSTMNRNQDYELFMRIIACGYYVENIPEVLLLYRVNDLNIERRKNWSKTRSHLNMTKEFYRKRYISFFDFCVVFIGHFIAFLFPAKLYEKFSNVFLRERRKS